MSWIRPAWPLALFALALPACPSDDTADSGNDSGADTQTSAAPTSDDGTETAEGSVCPGVEIVGETTDGAANPIMDTWGSPCTTDQECIDVLGDPDAVCDTTAIIYELPGGYCTKPCAMPAGERVVPDAADCDPNGGVACIGAMGFYERCAVICTDDAQCTRDGYTCRILPMIGVEGDARQCLMPECCLDTCAGE